MYTYKIYICVCVCVRVCVCDMFWSDKQLDLLQSVISLYFCKIIRQIMQNSCIIAGQTIRFSCSMLFWEPVQYSCWSCMKFKPFWKIESNLGATSRQEMEQRQEEGKLALMGRRVRWIRNRVCGTYEKRKSSPIMMQGTNSLFSTSRTRAILTWMNFLNK